MLNKSKLATLASKSLLKVDKEMKCKISAVRIQDQLSDK